MSQALTQKRKDQISKEVLKLRREPENAKCVDCSNRNCSYVCVNFSTFICSDCAGLYRKHCFRVKSCTVATFTEKEYENLKSSGGNEACNRKYMARWKKKSEFPLPKQGDIKGLDAFIHKKYVLKEWYKDVKEKEKKKKKKKKKKVDEYENKDSESKIKTKPPSSTTSKQSQENLQLERDFLESEQAPDMKNDDWDPWGEKSTAAKAVEPPVQQAPPQDDFLSGFVFDNVPAQTENKSNNDWDPFGSSSKQPPEPVAAAAPPKALHEKKPSVDLIGDLLSNITANNTDNRNDFGMGNLKKEAPPAEEKPKSPYNDPFSTLITGTTAPQPVASSTTSPQLQVRAAPPPVQQTVPVHYPMYMNTSYGAPYGMAQPASASQMNPYAPQYNMANQQAVNPFDTQVPTHVMPTIGQQMPYNNRPSAQMNALNYQLAAFDITPASQVSQDNPFS